MKSKNIVKVQIPLSTSQNPPLALVYNKQQDIFFEMDITEVVLAIMNKEYKKYFYYRFENDQIELLDEAPWQDW